MAEKVAVRVEVDAVEGDFLEPVEKLLHVCRPPPEHLAQLPAGHELKRVLRFAVLAAHCDPREHLQDFGTIHLVAKNRHSSSDTSVRRRRFSSLDRDTLGPILPRSSSPRGRYQTRIGAR